MLHYNNVLVTTTSTIEGAEIKKYIKPVSAHIVAAAGIFNDILASFTDILGGRSSSYERRLVKLYNTAIEKLKIEAFELGANAILGLKVDLDEVSGKTKEMFMITALGTAVIIDERIIKGSPQETAGKTENVSLERLQTLQRQIKIMENAENNTLTPDNDLWEFMVANSMIDMFPYIIDVIRLNAESPAFSTTFNELSEKLIALLQTTPEEKQKNLLYNAIISEENIKVAAKLCSIAERLMLFDAKYIKEVLQAGNTRKQKLGLLLLKTNKQFYNRADTRDMEDCIELVEKIFPERGTKIIKKQLLSSKEKELWQCECGKANDIGYYCSGCDKDIYGFTEGEIKPNKVVEDLRQKIELLNNCLI